MTNITCPKLQPGLKKRCIHYISNSGEAGFCGLKGEFRCSEAMKSLLPSITQSALKTLLQCPWKYYLTYIQGYSLKDAYLPDPIKLGAIWDKWWDHGIHTPSLFEKYEITDVQQAKLNAMWNAAGELEITVPTVGSQTKIHYPVGNHMVSGWADFNLGDGMGEMKFTSSPSWYDQMSNIHLQCGTYLLGNPAWKYVIMYICRVPALRMGGRGKNADETLDMFQDRIYKDIMSRPAYYFIGLNTRKKTFGKRYFRSEFKLDKLAETYQYAFKFLRYCADNHWWPKNELSCNVPTPCFFQRAKVSGVLSDEVYYKKNPMILNGGLR